MRLVVCLLVLLSADTVSAVRGRSTHDELVTDERQQRSRGESFPASLSIKRALGGMLSLVFGLFLVICVFSCINLQILYLHFRFRRCKLHS